MGLYFGLVLGAAYKVTGFVDTLGDDCNWWIWSFHMSTVNLVVFVCSLWVMVMPSQQRG